MVSLAVWKSANRPNYKTNVELQFPYSEVHYLGEYELVKVPVSLNNLIPHVDYWGEGRVESKEGIRGFTNCYNVNHQYQLVSSGPDLDRKIPNRIPIRSDDNCDTSSYIKDNSVLTVTIAGVRVNSNCVKDIARIVNNDHGKVVLYGVECVNEEISELIDELKKKGLIYGPNATLPNELQAVTYYGKHIYTILNGSDLADLLFNNVFKDNNYTNVVHVAPSLGELNNGGEIINNILIRLISAAPRKAMSFASKLWYGDSNKNVRNHLPKSFQHIFNEDTVTIVNKQYQQPLKLGLTQQRENDFKIIVWGDNICGITSERVSWKVFSEWSKDGGGVTFQLYNIHSSLFLKLDAKEDKNGDRKAWGMINSHEGYLKYYLEPLLENGSLIFFIINYEYNQKLKLDEKKDNVGDRLVWGHKGSVDATTNRFKWIIANW